MPFSRQRPRVAPTSRISARVSLRQRDLLLHSNATPKGLARRLDRAPVRKGSLNLRLTRDELDALILAAAAHTTSDRHEDRMMLTFLRYLEGLADRFAEPDVDEAQGEPA